MPASARALAEQIGVERLVGLIEKALESESPTERASAARLGLPA
jgi:hypothetical protein